MESQPKSCKLDPIPTWLLKSSINELTPTITKIINMSFQMGVFPDALEFAHITPLIKKQSADPDVLSNYRPIANLKFLAKTIERAVAAQVRSHSATYSLTTKLQSAFRKGRSVETALFRVYNDLLLAADNGEESILVLLDYSAAFDTIDHNVMLNRLEQNYGITNLALKWFSSYFSMRHQSVNINHAFSPFCLVNTGVSHGSVLGPMCFTLYTSPLEDIIASYGIKCMVYADDIQLYTTTTEAQRPCYREDGVLSLAYQVTVHSKPT